MYYILSTEYVLSLRVKYIMAAFYFPLNKYSLCETPWVALGFLQKVNPRLLVPFEDGLIQKCKVKAELSLDVTN
jgi:hypothetical protein